jgi:hypothetical protein
MSKKGNYKTYNYNRQSAGYQKNLYRQKLNQEGIKAPKSMSTKTFRIVGIAIAAAWIIAGAILI